MDSETENAKAIYNLIERITGRTIWKKSLLSDLADKFFEVCSIRFRPNESIFKISCC